MNEFWKQQVGANGGTLITGTTAVEGDWFRIVVNADVVFEELKVNGVDIVTDRGFATETLKAGMEIFAGVGKKFTEVKLTSGAVIVY
jgi:hypothetical protein